MFQAGLPFARAFARAFAHTFARTFARTFALSLAFRSSGQAPLRNSLIATLLSLLAGICPAIAQGTGTNPSPEVIMGQARSLPPEKHRTAPETSSFHARALTPLPAESYPRKSKRARKHRLDMDRDGYVSRSEFELEHQARFSAFRSADKNHDGKLDSEEMRQYKKLTQGRGRSG